MKTLNQICRYIYDCRFTDDDWKQVQAYCQECFKGCKIRKSPNPKIESTYQQFCDWVETGWGSGDMVSYGKTMGVVGSCTPEGTVLAGYCNLEGELIINEMKVLEPQRLQPLDDTRITELKKLIYDKGLNFYVRYGKFDKLYTPKKYFYIIIENPDGGVPDVGMYLESDNSRHHFIAYLKGNRLKMDCWIDADCTPLKPATEADIKRLHSTTSRQGWFYNERCHKFLRVPKKRLDNSYYYLNDRFELVRDKDDGSKIHTLRYEAGNYILDYTEGLLFMKEVKRMRGKE